MRAGLKLSAAIVGGLIAGSIATIVWLRHADMGSLTVGGWSGSLATGSVDADPLLRAKVAVTGLLALNSSQAIYLRRNTDDAGEPLREACRYRLSGGALPGRWWSITAYAADDFLPANSDDALSVDASEVRTDPNGRWSAEVGAKRASTAPWLSTRNAGRFDLTLRIYNPTAAARADLTAIQPPRVERLACGDLP